MKNHEHKPGQVFVFGSNEEGQHGKGAALTAWCSHGAVTGCGEGRMGGKGGGCYAIPTRWHNGYINSKNLESLPLSVIARNVRRFLNYARENPGETFFVTAIGTNLAGYKHQQIAPLFKEAPNNCLLPPEWEKILAELALSKVQQSLGL